LNKIRTGRASTGMLDTVQVDYYGSMVPIRPGGQRVPARRPHPERAAVGKGMGAKIEKAIRESDLGLNPASMATSSACPCRR